MNEPSGTQRDDQLFDTLGAADAMPIGAPPVEAIVERGRRERRRYRAAAVAGAAAVVVAVVGGVALVSGPGQRIAPADDGSTALDGGSEQADEQGPVPAPPGGMRWVAKGGVMVAVPAAWPTNALRCGEPSEDTVVLDPVLTQQCATPDPPPVSSVELRKDRTELRGDVEDLGDGIARGEPECQESGGTCTTVVRAEEPGITVYVDSTDADLVERIAASVQPVPEGAVVVPARALESRFIGGEGRAGYERQLRRAGLEVEAETLNPGGTFDIEPAPGTVVAEGSVVRLTRPSR